MPAPEPCRPARATTNGFDWGERFAVRRGGNYPGPIMASRNEQGGNIVLTSLVLTTTLFTTPP